MNILPFAAPNPRSNRQPSHQSEHEDTPVPTLDVSDLLYDMRVDVAYRIEPPAQGSILFGLVLDAPSLPRASIYWSTTRPEAELLTEITGKALPQLYPDASSPRAAARSQLIAALTGPFESRVEDGDVLACLTTWLLATSAAADSLRGKRCVGVIVSRSTEPGAENKWTVRLVGGSDPSVLQPGLPGET